MSHFDARVEKMIADGKFSGDGPAVLQMQKDARAAFSDYKQKFAKRGAGDTIGAAVEKILGKFSDTRNAGRDQTWPMARPRRRAGKCRCRSRNGS
jgi:hypothetical protein